MDVSKLQLCSGFVGTATVNFQFMKNTQIFFPILPFIN